MPTDPAALYLPFLDAAVLVVFLVAATRVVGLRSFSKMSGYDFAITVAMGSVLASVVVGRNTPFATGIAALTALFVVQVLLSRLRTRVKRVEELMDNTALLLMRNGEILADNLAHAKMTRDDLFGKLREANVLRLEDVRAAVFEVTGDVSILHGDTLDEVLLEGVRRRP